MKHVIWLFLLVPLAAYAQPAGETTVLNNQFQQIPASQMTVRLSTGNFAALGTALASAAASVTATATSIPTTGTWTAGTRVFNSSPAEQGSAGAKYVTTGWICLASGTPGTWVPMNDFDGN